MKAAIRFTVLSLLLLVGVAHAGKTEDEIIRATRAHFDALNAGDVEAHLRHHAAEKTFYGSHGESLRVYHSLDEQRQAMSTTKHSGFQSLQELSDIQVQRYGNVAVVTCYVTGTITLGDGSPPQAVRERRTAVLVKQGRDWKEVHFHSSPLAP